MTGLNVNDARCEALFASALQRSDAPTAGAVAEAISRTVRQFGVGGCASRMAQEFGDHPDAARDRMRWVRQLLAGRAVVGDLSICIRRTGHALCAQDAADAPPGLPAITRRRHLS